MAALSADFLVTSLIVVLVPGTGVIYTLCHGLFAGRMAGAAAALGCTLGIVPHLLVTILGLAALLQVSPFLFQAVKYCGVGYIFYLAWGIWRDKGPLTLSAPESSGRLAAIVIRGVLVNILNPKLSLFFLAFLPHFVPPQAPYPLLLMTALAGVFIAMTLVVFVLYALAAASLRARVIASPQAMRWLRYGFAAAFAGLALRLAFVAP